ncbi:hypothetical protein FNO01nite_30430 [Flavobacterium noncentrifugens]|nr:HK97 family phage prohead protease [Flavobacterium noncentrifugens]GEP52371.1 hypothetical protein FNO01nite_30430 [Flavobacterium noncentrifugens]
MMLNDHWNSTKSVLGKWENWREDKDLLLGDPIFDTEDPDAAKVSGQVEREFINSCSMGITFKREDLKIIGEELIMTKCELYEVSIVAVPSNANSIRLYADNGEVMKDEDVKNLCLSLQSGPGTTFDDETTPVEEETQTLELNNPINMKKITLSVAVLAALSFDTKTPEQDVEEVEKRVLALQAENTKLLAAKLAHETAAENAAELSIKTQVDLAIKAGKISAEKRADFEKLGKQDLSLLTSTLEGIPAKVSLSAETVLAGDATMTKESFQTLSIDAQLAFRNTSPEAYKKLFTK